MSAPSGAPLEIEIRGAREHNLADVDLRIPRDRLVVITGLSGSGKSTLAFDTLYAEGQRRYVESLSTYAKQFLDRMPKPLVDRLEGIAPAVAIEQRNPTVSSRSTVGTATEVYDYLRLLWARAGTPYCRNCGALVRRDTPGGAAVSKFSLATTEEWTDKSGQRQERTDWHNIDLWGKQAESLNEYLRKGKQVYVEGRLQTDEYTDKEGAKRKSTKVRCDRVVLLGGGGGRGSQMDRGETMGGAAPHAEPSEPLTDDDIPF